MARSTFNIPKSTKSFKTATALDVAARYFVYKLYDATGGRLTEQRLVREMGETQEAVLRSIERGWVTLHGVESKPRERSAALTEEGRRVARKGR
jgi:hypothetical protein